MRAFSGIRRRAIAGAAITAAASAAFVGAASTAGAAPMDPNCQVSGHGSESAAGVGNLQQRWTEYITYNQCKVPVRGIFYCNNLGQTGSQTYYGSTFSGTGSEYHTCDISQSNVGGGYQKYIGGQWYTFS